MVNGVILADNISTSTGAAFKLLNYNVSRNKVPLVSKELSRVVVVSESLSDMNLRVLCSTSTTLE